jgi:hypothetical protein
VRKASKISGGTPALKERHRHYFWGVFYQISPKIALKTTRHRGKSPEASRHSAPHIHEKKIKANFFQRT